MELVFTCIPITLCSWFLILLFLKLVFPSPSRAFAIVKPNLNLTGYELPSQFLSSCPNFDDSITLRPRVMLPEIFSILKGTPTPPKKNQKHVLRSKKKLGRILEFLKLVSEAIFFGKRFVINKMNKNHVHWVKIMYIGWFVKKKALALILKMRRIFRGVLVFLGGGVVHYRGGQKNARCGDAYDNTF